MADRVAQDVREEAREAARRAYAEAFDAEVPALHAAVDAVLGVARRVIKDEIQRTPLQGDIDGLTSALRLLGDNNQKEDA